MVLLDRLYNTTDMERLLIRVVSDTRMQSVAIQYENPEGDDTEYPVRYIESIQEVYPNHWVIRLLCPTDCQAIDLLGISDHYVALRNNHDHNEVTLEGNAKDIDLLLSSLFSPAKDN